eukprot:GFUD01024135.1.p1 GENE.GFUD01024135.1~~GFUD01024135.1.p1  ORF type:complete len:396 (-),score=123.25 GFUD01024135.1:88-1275(-)
MTGCVLSTYGQEEDKNTTVPTLNPSPAPDTDAAPSKSELETELATMVSQLTSRLNKQEKAMAKYHKEIVTVLEKQNKMLSHLIKKNKKSKKSTNSPAGPSLNSTVPDPAHTLLTGVSPDWSYTATSGWIFSHPICGGESQSPVNLETVDVTMKVHRKPLLFSSFDQVNGDTCKLINNGNNLALLMTSTPSPLPTISGGPLNTTSYHFSQAFFHWGSNDNLGSQHTIRKTTYPMEMQLVHQTSSKGETKMAITSFLFEVCQHDNPFLTPIIAQLGNIQTAGSEIHLDETVTANDITLATTTNDTDLDPVTTQATDSFSMEQLIQDAISGPYFSYKGSLTFPPCTQVDQWVVFRIPLDISTSQVEQFRTLQQKDGSRMVNNFRPVQPLGQRLLAFTM